MAGLVAGVALLVFANSIANGFVFDDIDIIRDNPRLDSPWSVGVFFTTSYWGESEAGDTLYRPLTLMSFAVDRAVFGPGPLGHHIMNVLANALLGVLVYAFTFHLLRRRDVALMTGLLFATHPVHSEVVANGVGRAELYAGITLFAAALAHLRHVRLAHPPRPGSNPNPGRAYLVAALLLYFVAMLFKESAAILPGLLFLAEWLVLERGKLRAMLPRLTRFVAYAAPLLLFLFLRARTIGGGLPLPQEVMAGASDLQRVLFASETLLRYLGQLALPLHLCAEYADYTRLVRPSLSDPLVLASLVTWLGAGVLVRVLAGREQFVWIFCMAWFALAILPVSNLVFPIGTLRADRLLFLPSFGFALAMAWGFSQLARGPWRRSVHVALAIVLVFYAGRSIARNADWRTQASLWTKTSQQNPGSAIAWFFIGDVSRDAGNLEEAERRYRRAFELREGAGFFFAEAHNRLGSLLIDKGDSPGAEDQYRIVLARDPNQRIALMKLGELLFDLPERRPEAADYMAKLAELEPDNFKLLTNLAQIYSQTGRRAEATQAIERALALEPQHPVVRAIRDDILRGGLPAAAPQ